MKRFFNFVLTLLLILNSAAFLGNSQQTAEAFAQTVYADSSYGEALTRGGTPATVDNVRVDYSYKIEDDYYISYKLPGYLSNYTCGITSGGVAIAYYDRLFDELIPNHTGTTLFGKYYFGSQGAAVNAMYDSLYTRMNATPAGVTMDGYITGVKSYVASKGRTATFTSTKSGTNQLNAAQYKAAIQSGKILSIFLQGFTIIDFGMFRTYDGYDTIYTNIYSGNHIMTAYGYLDVSYYNSSNQCFRTDTYLYVHTGFSGTTLGLLKLNQYCTIDDCYIVNIT